MPSFKTIFSKTRTASTRNRIFPKLKRRLCTLSRDNRDQRAFLFIAACWHYAFIRKLVMDVLLPKLETLDFQMRPSDYSGFLHQRSSGALVEVDDQLRETSLD